MAIYINDVDKATDIEISGKTVAIIQMLWDNDTRSQIIYRHGDRFWVYYYPLTADRSSNTEYSISSYSIDELSNTYGCVRDGVLNVVNQTRYSWVASIDAKGKKTYKNLYTLHEPFATLLGQVIVDATEPNSTGYNNIDTVFGNLTAIIDNTYQISSLGTYCFSELRGLKLFDCVSLKQLNTSTINSSGIRELYISSLTSIGENVFDGTAINNLFVSSDNLIAVDPTCEKARTFDQTCNVIVDRKLFESSPKVVDIKACCRGIDYISSDYTYKLGANIIANGNLKNVYLKNLSADSAIFANAYMLENIYVGNDTLSSVDNGYGRRACLVRYPNDPTRRTLQEIAPALMNETRPAYLNYNLSDYDIKEIKTRAFEYSTNVSTLYIQSDTISSYFGGKAVVDNGGTQLRFMSKYPATNSEMQNMLTSDYLSAVTRIGPECFAKNCYCAMLSSDNILTVGSEAFKETNISEAPGGHGQRYLSACFPNAVQWGTGTFSAATVKFVNMEKTTSIPNRFMVWSTNRQDKPGEISVYAPNAIEIGNDAFQGRLVGFNRAEFPKVQRLVGGGAFKNCKNLNYLNLNSCTCFTDYGGRTSEQYRNNLAGCLALTTLCCSAVSAEYMRDNQSKIGFPNDCSCFCANNYVYHNGTITKI